MLTDDYVIRMINLAIQSLLRILGLIKEGHYEDALQLIDLTTEQLLGLRAGTIRNLDDERIYFLLTSQDRLDTRRLELLADLITHEGDIFAAQNRPVESKADFSRALKFYLEVYYNDGLDQTPVLDQKIEYLVEQLSLPELKPELVWSLATYFEEKGLFARAETALSLLVRKPDLKDQIAPELVAFYQRLLQKPAQELKQAGLDANRLSEQLRQLQS